MQIKKLILIIFSTILVGFVIYNPSYAFDSDSGCTASSTSDMVKYLQACAQEGKYQGIDPSWAGRESMHSMIAKIAEGII